MALLVLIGDGSQTEISLDKERVEIGRHPDSAVQVPDGTVSGRHAQITKVGNDFFLEDLGSRNGTFVNDAPIDHRVRLRHNDRVKFGDADATFYDPTVDPGVAPQDTAGELPVAPFDVRNALVPGDKRATVPGPQATVAFTEDAEGTSTITGAVENKSRFGSLDTNPTAKLKAVLDISSSLAGTVDLSTLLPKILDRLFYIFKFADRGCVLLKDKQSGEMIPRVFKQRREDEDSTVRLSRTIVNRVLTEKVGILSADAASDLQFQGSESISELKIRSIMCAPLLGLDGNPTGIISIDSQNPLGQFTTDDLELLMAVAGQAALSYETARLLASYVEKQKQDSEMNIAKGIQHALLPEDLPTVEGYEFYASYDSAQAVGGDYYDCFVLPEGRIAVSFGDVAGKGVPGALIMSRMSSCVQSTLRHVQDVGPAMLAINEHMCDSAVEGRFVTYVLCIVDTKNHVVQLSVAGHMPPIIRKADGNLVHTDDRDLAGPPIGVMDGYPYEVETFSLDPGDIVVIVTDGVDEAMNPAGELYGVERTLEFIRNGPPKADALAQALLADVRRHANQRPQNDDITIMAFGRNPTA